MENLFKYATKELSQDAFLRWLFESCEDSDIGHIGKELLAEMINLYDGYRVSPNDIEVIETFGQSENIDIVVDFKLKGEVCLLAIEDKTTSSEHSNQLSKYKNVIDKWNEWYKKDNSKDRETFLVYYKTHKISSDERSRVYDAEWKEFEFKRINEFWSKYTNNNNMIVSQYANHVVEAWKNSENKDFPKKDNVDQWIGYFDNNLKNKIKHKCNIWVDSTYFGYAYFNVRPLNHDDKITPYLEIRSRDCLDNKGNKQLIARILLYGVEINEEQRQKYKEIINNKCKLFHYENNAKQMASTKRKGKDAIKCSSEDEFVTKVNEIIEEYLSIFC